MPEQDFNLRPIVIKWADRMSIDGLKELLELDSRAEVVTHLIKFFKDAHQL
jgi:hypothetical protein